MKNVPNRIFLQVGEEVEDDTDFTYCNVHGNVTWSVDKINSTDIEYQLVKGESDDDQVQR